MTNPPLCVQEEARTKMDPNKNPFHKWLGLDPKSSNPHHFKLLGVSPKLTNQPEIEAAVKAGVKRNLDLLAKVPTGQNGTALAKLKARIATAEKILLDPKLRAEYKLKLKTQLAASRSSKIIAGDAQIAATANSTAQPVPQPAELEPPSKQQTGLPPAAAPTSASVPPGIPAPTSVPAPPSIPASPVPQSTPQAPVVGGGPAVPPASVSAQPTPVPSTQVPMQAVPMAVPLNSPPPAATPVSAQPTPAADSPPPGFSFEQPAFERVNIRKIKRRRSKLAGPIVALTMLAAAGGGSFLIYQNFDALIKLGKKEDSPNNVNSDQPTAGEEENTKEENTKGEPLEKIDIENQPDLDVDEVLGPADPEDTPQQSSEPESKLGGQNPFSESEDPVEGKEMVKEMVKEISDDPSVAQTRLLSLDQDQLFALRRDIERGYRCLYRREFDAAEKCFQSASSVLDSVIQTDADKLIPKQQSLADRILDFQKLKMHIDGFWNQVKKSASSIPGGSEIVVGTQKAGFVESKPQSVILRRMGSNIEYNYSFCPPGLAMAIAERGAIEDIPTWNLQKAAFCSIDQLCGADHSRMIDEFVAVAQEAGHNCGDILRLSPLDLDGIGRPDNKLPAAFSKKELHPAVELFREQQDYSEPKKLDESIAQQHAETLFNREDDDTSQRLAVLEEARLLAIRAGAASLAEDAIYEMDVFGKVDRAEVTCDTFNAISKRKLESFQARQLLERAIGFLNSSLAESANSKSKKRLKDRLLTHAERYAMEDALRRLKQIEI